MLTVNVSATNILFLGIEGFKVAYLLRCVVAILEIITQTSISTVAITTSITTIIKATRALLTARYYSLSTIRKYLKGNNKEKRRG